MPKHNNKNKPSPLTKPLSGKRFRKELKAATRSQFRPLQRELAKQNRISKLQSQDISRYFRDYQQAIGRAGAATSDAYAQAGQTLTNYAAAAGSQDAALRQNINAANLSDVAQYGAQPDLTSNDLAVAGAGTRARSGANMAGAIATQGANSQGYFGSLKTNSKLAKAEALTAEARNRAQISDDKMALLREKADFKNEYRAQAREGERQFYLALKELRNANRQANKDRKFQAQQQDDQQKHENHQNNQDAQNEHDGNKKERRKYFNKAMTLLDAYDYKSISKDPKKVIAALANKGIPPAIARRAVNKWLNKHKGGGKGHKGGGVNDTAGGIGDAVGDGAKGH